MTENQRIKILRKEAGLSQKQLSVAMGLDQSAISAVESGRNKATDNFKILLSHILRVNKQYLETGEGPKKMDLSSITMYLPSEILSNNELTSQNRLDFSEKEKIYRELIAEKDKRLAEKDELIMVLKEQLAAKSKETSANPNPRPIQR